MISVPPNSAAGNQFLDLKTVRPERVSWVRIPLPAPVALHRSALRGVSATDDLPPTRHQLLVKRVQTRIRWYHRWKIGRHRKMVGPNGLEPSTSSVSRKRSNQTELRAYIGMAVASILPGTG